MKAFRGVSVAQILLSFLSWEVFAYTSQTIGLYGCQGRRIPMEECNVSGSKMRVRSVTIFATANTTKIGLSNCFSIQDCTRTIHTEDDVGLTVTFQHLYKWIVHKCEGKERCDYGGKLPDWWKLTGEFVNDRSDKCPREGTKYFTGLHAHISCVVEDHVPTRPPPPETTPRTTPTTPAAGGPHGVQVPIYIPILGDREKIYLGVAIGLSLSIIILILITLYCCERYRQHKRLGTILRRLGAPQADHNRYDDLEEYRKPDELWDRHNYNPDCMAEYSGVKPDEFVTMDRKSSEYSKQYIVHDNMTLRSTNSCSTINRSGYSKDLWRLYGQANYGYQESISCEPNQDVTRKLSYGLAPGIKPLSYESVENIEMERRMATALGSPKHLRKRADDNDNYNMPMPEIDSMSHYDSDEIMESSDEATTDTNTTNTRPYSPEGAEGDRIDTDSSSDEEETNSDAYSNDTRELHVIAEDHREEEEHEEGQRYRNSRHIENKRTLSNIWTTGLQWKVEVKYDGIGRSKSEGDLVEDSEDSVRVMSPTHYKCEVTAYDSDIEQLTGM